MSSILKALQKLEKDKTSRKTEYQKIDAEILRSKPARKISMTGIALAALLLFICGSGTMYLFMKRPAVSVSIPPGGSLNKAPAEGESAVVVIQSTISKEPIQTETKNDTLKPILQQREPALIKPDKSNRANVPQAAEKRVVEMRETPPEVPQQNRRTPQAAPAPVLTVNGIAFQDGGAESIAVVNGVSVSKGSVVDGVTVAEILKDRVKFKIGSELIEVSLGKSTR